jgi:hypothetical protein
MDAARCDRTLYQAGIIGHRIERRRMAVVPPAFAFYQLSK